MGYRCLIQPQNKETTLSSSIKLVEEFCSIVIGSKNWYENDTKYILVLSYWNGLSKLQKVEFVSAKIWNRKPYNHRVWDAITSLYTYLKDVKSSDAKIFANHSEGSVARVVIYLETPQVRKKMCLRLKKSSCIPVRRACAEYLPVSMIEDMISDPNLGISKLAVSRIGIDNCYKNIINTKPKKWHWHLKRGVIRCANLNELRQLEPLIEDSYLLESINTRIIQLLSREDALYELDRFSKLGEYGQELFQRKTGERK